jgi:hypothetical protein
MYSGLEKSRPNRVDARTYLFNTVQADYRPELVYVDEAKIRELDIPKAELKHMSSGLLGTAQGSSLVTGILYLLVLHSQNFQFWNMVNGQFVRYAFDDVVGANGMRRAFNQAWGTQEAPEMFRKRIASLGVPGVFGEISQPEARAKIFAEIFRGQYLSRSLMPLSPVPASCRLDESSPALPA